MPLLPQDPDAIRAAVAASYRARVGGRGVVEPLPVVPCCSPAEARAAADAQDAEERCCGRGDGSEAALERVAQLYHGADLSSLPAELLASSYGCGNPTAIAALQPGEVVLDLGSGAGLDCFLAARQVGPEGRVYGVDMTPEMVALARRNAAKLGATNVEFRLGEIEHLPFPDASVDVVISNCVINLSPDKEQVFREAFRVLRPGGRIQVSDLVWLREPEASVRQDLEAWAGCIAGALLEREFQERLAAAGFRDVRVTRCAGLEDTGLASANVLAYKPG